MARYQGQVAIFRATVPLGVKMPDYKFEPQDRRRSATRTRSGRSWASSRRELCSDEQFIRRVYLDITGTLPTPEQVKAFLADKDPNKRDKLIDALLETPEYSYYFANKWADILRVKRRQPAGPGLRHLRVPQLDPRGDRRRQALRPVRPRDPGGHRRRDQEPADGLVQATCRSPSSSSTTPARSSSASRMACAQCHHHPYEKWSQDDYWGMAAFFGQVGRKTVPVPGVVDPEPADQHGR